ncbi:MAG: hypothetical protein JW751_20740 [Polyangiaceae bacterium]|nr:hypothetical protein [Polyangiaceae bacterium]
MTAPKSLSDEQRRQLLSDLATLKSDADDAVAQDPKWFLPVESHTRALRAETLVVRGGRGAGKSALFQFLAHVQREPSLARSIDGVALGQTAWQEGHGLGTAHPPGDVLGLFADRSGDDTRRFFWYGRLCQRLSLATDVPLPEGDFSGGCRAFGSDWDLDSFATAAGRELGRLSGWMDGLERAQTGPNVLTYDALDRTGRHPRHGGT